MQTTNALRLIGALALIFWVVTPVHAAESAREPVGDFGAIDWVSYKLIASGIGVAPSNAPNHMQAKALAQRAAVVVAQRNLMEVIKGVHIDSTTVVEDFMVVNDTVASKVKGILTHAGVEGLRVLDDNAIEVTMSIPLQGELAETLLQMAPVSVSQPSGSMSKSGLEKEPQPMEQPGTAIEAQRFDMPGNSTTLSPSTVAPATSTPANSVLVPYTGLLIDARGTGFQPSLKPNVYCRQKLLYPGAYVGQTEAIEHGYVRYFRNMSEARVSERISPNPCTVKAQGTSDAKRSLVINSEAFDLLQTIVNTPDNFMSGRRVVIVY